MIPRTGHYLGCWIAHGIGREGLLAGWVGDGLGGLTMSCYTSNHTWITLDLESHPKTVARVSQYIHIHTRFEATQMTDIICGQASNIPPRSPLRAPSPAIPC